MTSDPADEIPADIRETFGDEYIAYVLNLGGGNDDAVAEPDRQQALVALANIARAVAALPDDLQRRFSLLALLFRRADDDSETLTTQLRAMCGGRVDPYGGSDPVSESLFYLARDVLPMTLLPPERDEKNRPWSAPDIGINSATFRNPWANDFARHFLRDPILGQLFPAHDLESVNNAVLRDGVPDEPFTRLQDVVSEVIWSDGSGGTVALNSIAASVLSWMFAIMSVHAAGVDELATYVDDAMETVRSLVSKKRVKLPLIASLFNIDLEVARVSTSTATLVKWDGRPISRFAAGSADAVLLLNVDMRILDVLEFDHSAPRGEDDPIWRRFQHRQSTMRASSRSIERELVRARLAVTLASDLPNVYAPQVRAWTVPKPISLGGSWYEAPSQRSSHPRSTIDQSGAERIVDWAERLQRFPDTLWLGSRRLLGATTERLDMLDAFVDAIVCWENLLGTGEGEVTFRVSAAMATLLEEDDPERRGKLFDEARELYRERSGLIHGSREPDPAEAIKLRDRAVEIAILAMRQVLDRPELRDAPQSSVRNRLVLLGT